MAASMDCTNISLVRNTGTVCTGTAIGSDTVTLLITPTQSCNKLVLILTSTDAASYTVDIAAGDFWAGTAMTQVTVAQNVPKAFVFESAMNSALQGNTADSADAYRIKLTLSAPATTGTSFQVLELP